MKVCNSQTQPELSYSIERNTPSGGSRFGRATRACAAQLPSDLRNWFSDVTIQAWVDNELQSLWWTHPQLAAYIEWHPESQLKNTLGVLAFSFLTSRFGSDEIATACRVDPSLKIVTQDCTPFPHELWSARRKHGAVLEQMISGVLTRALIQKLGVDPSELPQQVKEELRKNSAERLEAARHYDASFAC